MVRFFYYNKKKLRSGIQKWNYSFSFFFLLSVKSGRTKKPLGAEPVQRPRWNYFVLFPVRMQRNEQFTGSYFYSLHSRDVVQRETILDKHYRIDFRNSLWERVLLCFTPEKDTNTHWILSLWTMPPVKIFAHLKLEVHWRVLLHRQGTGLES